MVTPLLLALAGWALAALLMLGLWCWHLRIRNAGAVDVGWAASVVVMALLYAAAGPGDPLRKWLLAGMIAAWGGRLAVYLLHDRVLGRPEDPRYADLRDRRSPAAALAFFPFFQAQALLAALFAAPMLIVAFNPVPGLSALELGATLLWMVAVTGEVVADRQLARFKARPSSRGRTCTDGLWRYSRHPNYFFEWLIWVAYALFALASPWGVVALAAPALMLYFLFRVTGIPATEAQALRSRGDAYRRYQETTSAFVPWFPRRTS
jgi:steroid 5-alpha reductase family enzyme